jgi:DNA-binding transcriptional MocR family regulator
METQNITLAVPKALLRRIKILAAQRNTSVSALLIGMLQELVSTEDAYAKARRRHRAFLERRSNLGTEGHCAWSREQIHER